MIPLTTRDMCRVPSCKWIRRERRNDECIRFLHSFLSPIILIYPPTYRSSSGSCLLSRLLLLYTDTFKDFWLFLWQSVCVRVLVLTMVSSCAYRHTFFCFFCFCFFQCTDLRPSRTLTKEKRREVMFPGTTRQTSTTTFCSLNVLWY